MNNKPTAAMKLLCERIRQLPGVKGVSGATYPSGLVAFFIELRKGTPHAAPSALFVLGRCIDRRYWRHGESWRLRVSIDDVSSVPHYILESAEGLSAGARTRQIRSLADNLDYHMGHKAFVEGFGLKRVADRWRRHGWKHRAWTRAARGKARKSAPPQAVQVKAAK